jgi:hypothetical protein
MTTIVRAIVTVYAYPEHVPPVLVVPRSRSRLRQEGRTRTAVRVAYLSAT